MLTALQWQRLLRKKRSEMWRKVGRVLLVLVIWGAIAAYIACSAMLTQRHKSEQSVDVNKLQASRMAAAAQAGQGEKSRPMPVHVGKKVRPNDPCPCGSGKKYKHCHGA